jgi:hypothetical protein
MLNEPPGSPTNKREEESGGGGARKYNSGLEGSQAVATCPSDIGNVYNQIFYDAGRAALVLRFELKFGSYIRATFWCCHWEGCV